MYRSLFTVILMLFVGLPLQAQQSDAKTILDRTAEAFWKSGGVKALFTVRAPEGSSMGYIRLKGEKFLLETEEATTWFDGHTQWSYIASTDEVNVSEPTPEELQSINPYALLSLYEQGFTLKVGKPKNQQLASLHKVVLTATDRDRDLQCIILYVTKDTYHPRRISMAQRGGQNATAIIIDAYRTGENFPDSLFVFDKKDYPTAEVIDLR